MNPDGDSAIMESMADLIDFDGSMGEGGGQVLRTSLALSLITGKGFVLRNVRAGRPKPGLQPQHLMCVKAAAEVGGAEVAGASIGSSRLDFVPGEVRAGNYRFDIGTAGATGLVLHTVYLPLALRGEAASDLTITGGTHVRTSPAYPFLARTWRPYLSKMGLTMRLEMERPGFYPRGGGILRAGVPTAELSAASFLEREKVETADVEVIVAGLDAGIGRRMARKAKAGLEELGLAASVDEVRAEGGPGCAIAISVGSFTSVVAGERGKPAEKVAEEALDEVAAWLLADPAAVDLHSGDQILLPLALAAGASEYTVTEVTRHLTTNAAVIALFVDRKIVIEGKEGERGRVKIEDGPAV